MVTLARAAALTLICMSGSVIAAVGEAPPAHAAREVLPETVIPTHYELLLSPDADALTFRGKLAITVDVHAATSDVVLNAVGLAFQHATFDGGPDAVVTFEQQTGRADLHFSAPLALGQHVLSIEYTGRIAQSTLGFFAMDYSSPAGPRRTLATNFEPAHARELLPCWDEPARAAAGPVSNYKLRHRDASIRLR